MKGNFFYGCVAELVLSFAIVGLWNTLEIVWNFISAFRRYRRLKKELESVYDGGEIIDRYRDYQPYGMTFTTCENGCCSISTRIFEETVKFKNPKGKILTARRFIAENNPEYDGPRSTG